MPVRAHSFDVFDTLLVRTLARPDDVLWAAAERVVPPGPQRQEVLAEVVRRRVAADHATVRASGRDAVPLAEFIATLDLSDLGLDAAALGVAELAVEREMTRPVSAGRERVQAARATGLRVLFISDMYLPRAVIEELLLGAQIARPGEPVYVSGELGLSKRTGRLFDHVLAQEGLAPDELLHHGDDPVTDLAMPRRRGIGVAPMLGAKLTRLEETALEPTGPPVALRARLAGASRAARVAAGGEHGRDAAISALGADVVGPVLTAFVAWMLEQARADGVERLYFVARDGQALLRVAERIRRPGDPELRYLYGSRKAWMLPSVTRADAESLAWLPVPPMVPHVVGTFLRRLELEPAEVAGPLAAHGLEVDEVLDARGHERFLAFAAQVEDLILARAAVRRERLLRYCEQEGLTDGTPWALVDLGWNLRTQGALRAVLATIGHGDAVRGTYLGVAQDRPPLSRTGPYRAWVRVDDGDVSITLPEVWPYRKAVIVEQLFVAADHGTCLGYADEDGRVVPVLRDVDADPEALAYVQALRAAVDRFAAEALRHGLRDEDPEHLRTVALHVGRVALEEPRRDELAAFAGLNVGDDHRNDPSARPLVGPVRAGDVAGLVRNRIQPRDDFDTTWRMWPEAALELSPAPTRLVLAGGGRFVRAARRGGLRTLVRGSGSGGW
jgi:FMN phosphatase YigB (HAD superfamily)